jgi:DNA (cytosine-5)-methyltransferase 1
MTTHDGGGAARDAIELRFVDLCAGLGGFHRALHEAEAQARRRRTRMFPKNFTFRCVMAAELDDELRSLYVKNFPELAAEYQRLHPPERVRQIHEFADLYDGERLVRIHGDIRTLLDGKDKLRAWPGTTDDFLVPEHDLLCAGFPCQPFSKSGAQKGFEDLNGTVFRMLAVIIKHRTPRYVLLENVGNFERHDGGNTWHRVRKVLEELGYDIRATTHVGSDDGGDGLLSPHHLGFPHHRERFFVVAQRVDLVGSFPKRRHPFPLIHRNATDSAAHREKAERAAEARLSGIIMESEAVASADDFAAASLHPDRVRCVDHWNRLLEKIREHDERAREGGKPEIGVPSFPIWGYELDPWNHYPVDSNPADLIGNAEALRTHRRALVGHLGSQAWFRRESTPQGDRFYLANADPLNADLDAWVASWPKYASSRGEWPKWKQQFIRLSRGWGHVLWQRMDGKWLRSWIDELLTFVPSHQKLEFNCMGGDVDLWTHILQFRPSGLRVKRRCYVPALIAMTATQIPVVPRFDRTGGGPGGRHILPGEGLVLQGFPRTWALPKARGDAFAALGNGVNVELVAEIVLTWLFEKDGPYDRRGRLLEEGEREALLQPLPAPAAVPLFAHLPEVPAAPGVATRSSRRHAPTTANGGALHAK